MLLVSRTREKLEEVAKQVEEAGGTAHVHPADLSDLEDIDRLAQEVLDEHGGVDILINNAGRSIRRSVARSYDRFHDYERTMQLNYFGALKLILALPARDARAQVGPHHQRHRRSACRRTRRASRPTWPRRRRSMRSRAASAPECVADNVKFTTVYMPLVRTPMIAPTDIYKAFPTLTPDEAAQMLADAMIDKPKRVASRLGHLRRGALRGLAEDRRHRSSTPPTTCSRTRRPRRASKPRTASRLPAAEKDGDDEMSTEAVAMAYLMRGVHF